MLDSPMWKVWRGPYIMDYLNCKQLKKKKERKKRSFFHALETDVETDLEAREMYRVIRTRY